VFVFKSLTRKKSKFHDQDAAQLLFEQVNSSNYEEAHLINVEQQAHQQQQSKPHPQQIQNKSSSFVSSSSYEHQNKLEKSIVLNPSSSRSEKESISQKRNNSSRRKQQSQHQQQQQQLKEINLYLIGYSKINYLKDNYFCLCEYLIHSVYDSKSLENFELKQYLSLLKNVQFDFICYYKKTIKGLSKSNSFYTYYYALLNNLIKSVVLPTRGESKSESNDLDYELIDERISKAFKCINIPSDWTLLGQACYLSIGNTQHQY
jgi:hypothetical protein